MGKRRGKKTVGAWVTPALQAKIDEWLRRHPGTSQTHFALTAYAEKLRNAGIKVSDEEVFSDYRVRRPEIEAEANSLEGKASTTPSAGLRWRRDHVRNVHQK